MAKAVNCPCGETMTADTDDELVKLVQEPWQRGSQARGQPGGRPGYGSTRRLVGYRPKTAVAT